MMRRAGTKIGLTIIICALLLDVVSMGLIFLTPTNADSIDLVWKTGCIMLVAGVVWTFFATLNNMRIIPSISDDFELGSALDPTESDDFELGGPLDPMGRGYFDGKVR